MVDYRGVVDGAKTVWKISVPFSLDGKYDKKIVL